jgi:hypothetical protein
LVKRDVLPFLRENIGEADVLPQKWQANIAWNLLKIGKKIGGQMLPPSSPPKTKKLEKTVAYFT